VAIVAQLLTSNLMTTGVAARVLLFTSMISELLGIFFAMIYHHFYQYLEDRQLIESWSALLPVAAGTPIVLILIGMVILTIALIMELC
jgi:hypothetical protein